MYEADIQAAIDKWLETERKAAAWDWLRENLPSADTYSTRELLACMDALVHPAHNLSKR